LEETVVFIQVRYGLTSGGVNRRVALTFRRRTAGEKNWNRIVAGDLHGYSFDSA
jgi:hypothetical protein